MKNPARSRGTLPRPVGYPPAAYSNVVVLRSAEPRVPDALKPYPQFVVWRLETISDRPKPAKVPYDPKSGQRASVTDPTTWGSYQEATAAMVSGRYSGLGFVFTANDPFVFLDFDDCKDDNGNWIEGRNQWQLFGDAARECSQSGNGLHTIVTVTDKAFLANHANKWRRQDGGMNECYASERFVAFGPWGWQGEPQPGDSVLPFFVPLRTGQTVQPLDWADKPLEGYAGPADDDDLIRRALESRGAVSALGGAPPFLALWTGDAAVLGQFYPDHGGKGRGFDHSAADMALMNALAWWTGCNQTRMWSLFKRSALYRPDKERTALRALDKAASEKAARGAYFKSREQRMKEAAAIGDDVGSIATPMMTLDEATEKLVFVRTGDGAVLHRDRKAGMKWGGAKRDYAASKHTFDTGEINSNGEPKIKTVEVLEAWKHAPNKLTVDELTWQPGEREFCKALDGAGTAYNTYVTMKRAEPPTNWHEWLRPFIDHVAYLIPNEAERVRFLQWLAHIIQRPHELPHTCYLFYTPTHGTGRGTLAEILARVFRGSAAIGVTPQMIIGDGFNGRLSRKLLATVDEVREGTRSAHSREAQAFKSRITETERHINPKYGVQSVEKNCCRWLFFSQYEDAIPFDNNDRRVIVIANPTTAAPSEWFEYLRSFMERPEFFASVQHYLATLDLTGFKAGAHAPLNDAKRRALAAMESSALQAARQFAAEWGGTLAAVSDLANYVGEHDWPKHSRYVRSLIEAAGMVAPGRRVKISGVAQWVLIVQPSVIPPEALAMITAQDIAARIINARTS